MISAINFNNPTPNSLHLITGFRGNKFKGKVIGVINKSFNRDQIIQISKINEDQIRGDFPWIETKGKPNNQQNHLKVSVGIGDILSDPVDRDNATAEINQLFRQSSSGGAPRIQFNPKADMSGQNLVGVSLRFMNMQGVNLVGAVLSNSSLQNTDLSDSNLSQANMSGVNAYKTILDRANLAGANLAKASLEKASLRQARMKGADLMRANLYETDLLEADLRNSCLIGIHAIKANLSNTKQEGSDLRGAQLDSASLNNIDLSTHDLMGTVLDRAIVDSENVKLPEGLRGIDFANSYSGAKLTAQEMTQLGLTLADITKNPLFDWKYSPEFKGGFNEGMITATIQRLCNGNLGMLKEVDLLRLSRMYRQVGELDKSNSLIHTSIQNLYGSKLEESTSPINALSYEFHGRGFNPRSEDHLAMLTAVELKKLGQLYEEILDFDSAKFVYDRGIMRAPNSEKTAKTALCGNVRNLDFEDLMNAVCYMEQRLEELLGEKQ